MSKIINGRPTKSLFIDALTKDIELIDAVGDLVDNSADAAFRLKGKAAYAGLYVKISLSSKSFTIEDNCGGIALKTAKDIAFRLGRPTGVNATAGLIGRYGIGMKRAFFKIGRDIIVESYTSTSHLKVPINIDAWRKDDSDKWDFKATVFKTKMVNPPEKIGTRIAITNLNDEIANEIVTPRFAATLVETLQTKHKQLMTNGLEIMVNSQRIIPEPFELKISDHIVPTFFHESVNGTASPLDIKIVAGVGESDAKEAGWYICCNGRFILEADQTIRTGWGEVGDKISIPKSHHQFARFRGFVFFECDDPSRIPWNSTKTGIDMENPDYKRVRKHMIAATRPVIDFLNNVDAEQDLDAQPLTEALKVASSTAIAVILQGLTQNRSFTGVGLRENIDPNRPVRISYQKPLKQVKDVRDRLGVDTNREVGLKTFEYYYEFELGKKS
jgi:hypothetical protein